MALRYLTLNLLFAFTHAATSSLRVGGTTVALGDIPYWIAPDPIANVHQDPFENLFRNNSAVSGGYVPLSVVHSASSDLTTGFLDQEFARFLANDDVWSADFSHRAYSQFHWREDVSATG